MNATKLFKGRSTERDTVQAAIPETRAARAPQVKTIQPRKRFESPKLFESEFRR
jgi:hypothetical protein